MLRTRVKKDKILNRSIKRDKVETNTAWRRLPSVPATLVAVRPVTLGNDYSLRAVQAVVPIISQLLHILRHHYHEGGRLLIKKLSRTIYDFVHTNRFGTIDQKLHK
jgi:predicted DCC family thiol-disulfide oxidoreductase YuxK